MPIGGAALMLPLLYPSIIRNVHRVVTLGHSNRMNGLRLLILLATILMHCNCMDKNDSVVHNSCYPNGIIRVTHSIRKECLMLLTRATVQVFKSIENSGSVLIDPDVTVLVGQNESGKTAFLQALHKARPVEKGPKYDVIEDYPRRDLNAYQRKHESDPALVTQLTYALQDIDLMRINKDLGINLLTELSFDFNHNYSNTGTISLTVPEQPYLTHLAATKNLSSNVSSTIGTASSIREALTNLGALDLNQEDDAFLANLNEQFIPDKTNWKDLLSHYIWRVHLFPFLPKFLSFDDYYLLPGKVNLPGLRQRIGIDALSEDDRTVLSLLRMAEVDLDALLEPSGYEPARAKLEAISNTITDQLFKYWTQNTELDVEFDIRADPHDQPSYGSGNNLYIRIRNRRHRVTVPFSQRSRGFIWFFSFLVWFDGIREQLGTEAPLVLLLDEPGLSLHALAQADLLRYMDVLAEEHQVIYTTHSPFMVRSDRLYQVRTVEDRREAGTKITDNVSSADAKTLFPLQAALGYTIAQNLFISPRNLLVEGPADLIYLKFFSAALNRANRTTLRDDITLVPVGGLDKLATFVALLGANDLELAVLHDYAGNPEQRLESLVRDKLIGKRQVLNYAMFRSPQSNARSNPPPSLTATDVEDLISPTPYLRLFNSAFKTGLGSITISESDLPPGDRLVMRIDAYLKAQGISLRPSGGFNHYLVASHLAEKPSALGRIDTVTLERFEQLFKAINLLFTE